MPTISRFFGVTIAMFHNEHGRPHFHARYSGHKASVAVDTLEILEGTLPPRVLGLVIEWAALHRAELLANWVKAANNIPPDPIEPLE